MPDKENNVLKYKNGEKFMKAPFNIYVDMESLLEKISTCHNNPNESSATKTNKHTPSGYSLFTHCLFDTTENRPDYYEDLKKHVTKIINYKKRNDTSGCSSQWFKFDYHFVIKELAK